MKTTEAFFGILLSLCVCGMAPAAMWYVDGSVSETGDGTSWETAFETIQEGIDVAEDGDTVIVAPGTYVENVRLKGKNVTLTGIYPPDPDVVANTIIDGNRAGPVVTFAGTENETCVLTGFTIQNGESADGGGGILGGGWDDGTRATIRNNIIARNRAGADCCGGGLVYCHGLIQKNVITGNSAGYGGGGLAYCHGTIAGNRITDNSAESGGGIYDCDGLIRDNVISGNSCWNHGGGIVYCDGMIGNNVISQNSGGDGGGLYECDGTILNNTIVGNSARSTGGGLCQCDGVIRNCIIWGNEGRNQVEDCVEPSYSCVQHWAGRGEGNMSYSPYFVDMANGDYHLKSWSPCIDAGDPSSDFSKEPRPNGGRINMGAYGNTPEAASASPDTDGDLLPDEWEMLVFGELGHGASEDSDGDLWSNLQEYRHDTDPSWSGKWYVDGAVARSGDGTSWEAAFKRVQEGINAASDGDTVIVAEGTYVENIRFCWTLPKAETIFEEDFESYTNLYSCDDLLNAGWEVVNGSGNPDVAWRLWNTGSPEFLGMEGPDITGMSGNYVIADSDLSGEAEMDEQLITPEVDCRAWEKVRLHFDKNYRVYLDDMDHLQIAEVDVRVLNEGTGNWGEWINVIHHESDPYGPWGEDRGDSRPEAVDLSVYADGKRIQLRWHYYDAVYDWWFAIDDILVSGERAGGAASPVILGDGGSECSDGKNITLRSTDPSDPITVGNTVIEARDRGAVATFTGTEGESCRLAGFTIRGGEADYGGGISGGTWENRTHATIRNNAITDNEGYRDGGGVAFCDGVIQDNIIAGNSANSGGGLARCDGIIRGNRIIENSVIFGGGGLYECDGAIRNNVVAGNSAWDDGGGLYDCDGAIVNNTIVGNSAGDGVGGIWGGEIRNCIIWGNIASGSRHQLWSSAPPTYSCIQSWHEGGEGNTAAYPYFVDLDGGDYHLRNWSPCIDAGDPFSDYAHEPQPNGGRINMGAYGNTGEASSASEDSDEDLLPDDWEIHVFGDLTHGAAEDVDGDGWSNLDEYFRGMDPVRFRTWYVDGRSAGSGDGTSWETAFNMVYKGMEAASDGDMVVVAPGTYAENVRFLGKNIVLTSTDPSDPAVVASTILDGRVVDSVVRFLGMEDESCVLCGFTIRKGRAETGGGICGRGTRATIRDNVITSNTATEDGGGLADCQGLIQNNTISENWARHYGGGLQNCNSIIRNNIIVRNKAIDYGGGLDRCSGTIENCVICYNSADRGGGLRACLGTIRNCIIWGNTASREGHQVFNCSLPSYCCIQNWREGGIGNISAYPYFVDPDAGDYRLESWSPCVDAGDPSCDFSLEPEPNGGRIDMGTYGNTSEAVTASEDSDGDLLPDDWEMLYFGNLWHGAPEDADGNGWSNLLEYMSGTNPTQFGKWHVDAGVAVSGDGTSWQAAFKRIQEGIDAASEGDVVVAAPGTYLDNISFPGGNITLTGTAPQNAAVVTNTVIDGGGEGPAVTFTGSEGESCLLTGFTIRGGFANYGGGIAGNGTYATIRDNVIAGNSAQYDGGGLYECDGLICGNESTGNSASEAGGGLRFCDGTVQNNTISGNSAVTRDGGGLSRCDGTIEANVITGNSTGRGGGGLHECEGTIRNNDISGNVAGSNGGGLLGCGGTIRGNTVSANSAARDGGGLAVCPGIIENNIIPGNSAGDDGGGAYYCGGTIQNNTICGNSATERGGGLALCSGTVRNNTVGGNAAKSGGALYGCKGTISNCIIWGNSALDGPQLLDSRDPTYSCIEGSTAGGEGNIGEDPRFVGAESADFRLLPFSPCIDAGENYFSAYFDTDVAGMPRILYGGGSFTVDMGACEHVFIAIQVESYKGKMILTWSSIPDRTYSILYSDDLLGWHVAEENILSTDTETTSWTDDGSMTGLPPWLIWQRFYRVREKP